MQQRTAEPDEEGRSTAIVKNDPNTHNSTLRERIVEHEFIAKVLRRFWDNGITNVEVLHSEFDAGGYDLVISVGKTIRYIQLKTVGKDGKAAHVSVSRNLEEKQNGCVVWIVLKPNHEPDSYRWFGQPLGKSIDLTGMKEAKHSKGNALGKKTARPNHRIVTRARFTTHSFDELFEKLFQDAGSVSARANF